MHYFKYLWTRASKNKFIIGDGDSDKVQIKKDERSKGNIMTLNIIEQKGELLIIISIK